VPSGIGMATRLLSGWGLKFFDYDNDGNLDLFLANTPTTRSRNASRRSLTRSACSCSIIAAKDFENVSAAGGPAFAEQIAARGLALGDFNNDGAVDVLVAVNNVVSIDSLLALFPCRAIPPRRNSNASWPMWPASR
jgi:enediyne biosynthesis protein E4